MTHPYKPHPMGRDFCVHEGGLRLPFTRGYCGRRQADHAQPAKKLHGSAWAAAVILVALSPLAYMLTLRIATFIYPEVRGLVPVGGGFSSMATPTPSPTNPPPAVETFYVRASGAGTAPETTAGAWDATDFNTAGNWTTDANTDDGKIGPGDTVVLLDTDGDIPGLAPQGSGTEDNPITIKRRNENSTPVVDGAGTSTNALLISGKSWLIIDGIHFEGGSGGTSGVILLTGAGSENNIIRNCEIGTSTQNGILFAATAGASNEIRLNNIHGNTKAGIAAVAHVASTDIATATIINGNTVSTNTQDAIKINANYWTVTKNTVTDNGSAGAFYGIHSLLSGGVGNNNTITYNLIHGQIGNGNDGDAIRIDGSADVTAYYNVAYSNAGPCIGAIDAPDLILYNNSCDANETGGTNTQIGEIRLASTVADLTTATLKNNLAVATATSGHAIYIDAGTSNNTLVITNNDWWRATGNWYFFNATGGATLATWNALAAGIGTDISGDPLFVAPPANLDIQTGSPCMEAGVGVGLALDFSGGLIAGLPDCGAYEGPPQTGEITYVGGGYKTKGHLGIPSLGFDTCTVTKNDANAPYTGPPGTGSADAGGNPTGGANTCGTDGGSCEGTFRQCVGSTRNRPRLVNFSVPGPITIHACDPSRPGGPYPLCPPNTLGTILIDQPYMTIDGMTAPSPGITILQADTGKDDTNGGPAQAIIKYIMTHDILWSGIRTQGWFVPYGAGYHGGPTSQVFMVDGDSNKPECSTWDDLPACPTCPTGATACNGQNGQTHCGSPDPLYKDIVCYGNRRLMFAYNTWRNGADEIGALWRDTDNVTREHNLWIENYHPAGFVANTICGSGYPNCGRDHDTDWGNVWSANGERTPTVRRGSYNITLINNFEHDWRNYSFTWGTGNGGYGIHVEDPPNYGLLSQGNVLLPGTNGVVGGALYRPDWDCYEAGNPGAGHPCTDGWCQVFWEKNLFARAHVTDHCRTNPTTYTKPVRAYPLPTVIDPTCKGDANCTITAPLIQALIQQAGVPYPTADEQAILADVYADWLARALQCASDPVGKGCQNYNDP